LGTGAAATGTVSQIVLAVIAHAPDAVEQVMRGI
jgi:hypothetical protein